MTEKFYAYDRLINVIHQRSDLPSLFVEGGSTTLDEIANAINPMELSCQNH